MPALIAVPSPVMTPAQRRAAIACVLDNWSEANKLTRHAAHADRWGFPQQAARYRLDAANRRATASVVAQRLRPARRAA
jgi:hypothetical protein